MRAIRLFVGLIIICLGLMLFLSPMGFIFLIDNKGHTYEITDTLASGNTSETISFNFSKDFISDIYKIDNGEKVYLNYVNVYIEAFLDNTTAENITYYTFNDVAYVPENKSYETSLVLIEGSLNSNEQELVIYKDSGLEISKVTLEYYGADYNYYDEYNTIALLFAFIILMLGLILCVYSV